MDPTSVQAQYATLPDGTPLTDANTSGAFAGTSASQDAFLSQIAAGIGGSSSVFASIPWWAWALLAGAVVYRIAK